MGDGTFGRVVEAIDTLTKRKVAIKVVRDVKRYTEAAKIEADILKEIGRHDPEGESKCVRLLDTFIHQCREGSRRKSMVSRHSGTRSNKDKSSCSGSGSSGSDSESKNSGQGQHMCLVFESLGVSLYDFLKNNNYRGFFVTDIQQFALESLRALSFLRTIKLTHTDLKPENILLEDSSFETVRFPRGSGEMTRRPLRTHIKLIDFGGATFEHDHHCSVINTRQYRAPEVILGLGWDMSSDMWSLGCILMELYTGEMLFATHENMEHLAMMEAIVEPFPEDMLLGASKSSLGKKYVTATTDEGVPRLDWPRGASSSSSVKAVAKCEAIERLVDPRHIALAKFVRFMLRIDPRLRPTPTDALQHPFLTMTTYRDE